MPGHTLGEGQPARLPLGLEIVGYTTLRVPLDDRIPEAHRPPLVRRRHLRVWLDPRHGAELLRLDYDLCWATTWMADANRWIAPVVGLPELPFVDFLHHVNPRIGLRDDDFRALADFARSRTVPGRGGRGE